MAHIPRKRFGQHFLKDEKIIDKIVAALAPNANQRLVEIGPGQGVLTAKVLKLVPVLYAVEIDKDLAEHLKQSYPTALNLYQQDALRFDFLQLVDETHPRLRVFGNLPYNISTPILFHLLENASIIEDMLFMLQKEVIVRMAAKPNHADYGRLTVMVQYHCAVTLLFDVGPNAFSPPPKVMSSIVHLTPYGDARPHPLAKDYKHFANIVNAAFQQRRKTLRNALKDCVSLDAFNALGIDPQRRPETLSVTEFVQLSNASHD